MRSVEETLLEEQNARIAKLAQDTASIGNALVKAHDENVTLKHHLDVAVMRMTQAEAIVEDEKLRFICRRLGS